MANEARFAVGIDLGTTHTVVAYASLTEEDAPRVFAIPQWTSASEWQALPLLASALYRPLPGEMIDARWDFSGFIVGEYAKRRGTEVEGRVVLSAKSWLSHAAVDRTAPILPWGVTSSAEFAGISPLDASARVLEHVRATWNEDHPEARLEDQRIVLTVPASFDETARELTVRAAEAAGLRVKLLEEPQAAFYAWLAGQTDASLSALIDAHGGRFDALVCDVGGGTTDLSLLRLSRSPDPSVERVAVGRHLLLGGDNMDLALAHALESQMAGPEVAPDAFGARRAHLDPHRFGQLWLACRAAKERLLGADPPEEMGVAVGTRGAQLVGGTLRGTLRRAEVQRIVLDGFFPMTPRRAMSEPPRSALVAFGLSYERDVAITRHLGRFCERHLADQPGPRAVLFNGGVFLSPAIAARVLDVLGSWTSVPVLRLTNDHPELAVALGAVSFARATMGRGRRIRGGLGRGYYVGVAGGASGARSLVCVVPRGAEEGQRHVVEGQPLALLVGRPARFELFASDRPLGHRAGDVVSYDEQKFEALPPVAVRFGAARTAKGTEIKVALEGQLSEVGTLDLACVALEPDPSGTRPRFQLAFQIRPGEGSRPPSQAPTSVGGKRLEEAERAIERVFAKGHADVTAREVKDLHRELDRILGDRSEWSALVNRHLFDVLFRHHRGRRRSADHERIFWQLAGFCLRPGFGHPDDAARAAAFASILPERLAFADETRGWQAFWIAVRRVAAGLDDAAQTALRDVVDPFVAPASMKKKRPKGIRAEALDEMLEMAASLERVLPDRRAELGDWIVERTWTRRDPRLWVAVGKIGARAPTYASTHHVVAPLIAERWIDHLLRDKWEDLPGAAGAASQMARRTGDRARDVSESVRREVEKRLVRAGAREELIVAVREVVPLAEQERAAFFGEGLPVGLRLVDAPPARAAPVGDSS